MHCQETMTVVDLDQPQQPLSALLGRRQLLLGALAGSGTVAAILARSWWQQRPVSRGLGLLADQGAEVQQWPLAPMALDLPLERPPAIAPSGAAPPPATTTLRQLQANGDLLLVHFWASWCPPCLEELPAIAQMAELLHDRKLQLIAVSYDDTWDAADAVLQKTLGTTRPAHGLWLRDPQGQSGDDKQMLRTQLGTDKLPETWIVADGQVLCHLIAGQPWTQPRLLRALQLLAPRRTNAVKEPA
jgi:thiol-disulfide isomerase/thioredoxin